KAAASRLNSAENVRRCLLIRHLSHGEDFRLNRCPGSVDHYNRVIFSLMTTKNLGFSSNALFLYNYQAKEEHSIAK
ncbi:hypothetical protein, partial [Pseudomonas aeruginosa]